MISFDDGVTIIYLADPEIGNDATVHEGRLVSRTITGAPRQVRDADWPDTDSAEFEVWIPRCIDAHSTEPNTTFPEFLTFIEDSHGKQLEFYDWEDNVKNGVLDVLRCTRHKNWWHIELSFLEAA